MAVVDRARPRLGTLYQLFERSHAERRMHYEDVRHSRDKGYRSKISLRVVRHLGEDELVYCYRRRIAQQERIPVRRAPRNLRGADVAARAGAIFGKERLAE